MFHNKRFIEAEGEERQAGHIRDPFMADPLLKPCGVHFSPTYEAGLRVFKLKCVFENVFHKVSFYSFFLTLNVLKNLNFHKIFAV